jgi:hypothetical protein
MRSNQPVDFSNFTQYISGFVQDLKKMENIELPQQWNFFVSLS